MIPNTNLTIVTDPNKFPELHGEAEEMINAGTYGKSLCIFVQERLGNLGAGMVCMLCLSLIESSDRQMAPFCCAMRS